jgi:uncharacterized surface protein with fasciclin (FAS1) repeats
LLYHVAEGALDAATIVKHDSLKTLQGSNLHVSVQDDGIFLNHSKLLQTDLKASNGIIHVIDRVLLPK